MIKITVVAFLVALFITPSHAQDKLNFPIQTLNGDEITPAALYAKGPVLITFWALWCEPCRVELRALQPIFERYKAQGFSVLAINQDSPKSVSKVRSFVSSHQLTFDVALDPNGELLQRFNGPSIPFAVLYNSRGVIAFKRIGYLPGDEKHVEKEIQKLLNSGE